MKKWVKVLIVVGLSPLILAWALGVVLILLEWVGIDPWKFI